MKRIFAVVLAVVMVLPLSVTALAATSSSVKYPVGSVSTVGFLADDDGVVDLDSPVTSRTPVPYGETVYYPLLNTGSEGAAAGDEELEKAQKALEAAQKAYDDAEKKYEEAVQAAKDAKTAYEEAESALSGNTSKVFDAAETALSEYESAKKALDDAQKKLTDAKNTLSSKQNDLKTAQNQKAALDKLTDSVIESRIASLFPKASTGTDIVRANIPASKFPETTAVSSSYAINLTNVTLEQAKSQIRTKVNAATNYCSNKITTAEKAVDTAQKAVDNAQSDVAAKTTPANAKRNALQKRLDVINALFSPALSLDAETVTASELASAKKKTPNSSDLTAARDKAKAASEAADKAETSAKNAMGARKKTLDEAQAAYDAASQTVDSNYRFVHESSAVSNAKVTASWSSGKKYIVGASIIRKAAYSSVYSLKASSSGLSNSSSNRIYFVAVETQASGSKHESDDADGRLKVKKSGSNGFSIESDVSLWLEYQTADNSGVIPKNPTLFDEDDGFDSDEEYTFYFEEDDDSYFVVNTKHQKEILLAFNTEYDEKIADRVEKSNPEADLDFYNGNFARFNRTGKLYLSYPEKDAYVYAISSSGNLTQVTNAKYDSSEEAFVISTNVLGRYMISNEKLKIVDEGEDSSSSSSTTSSASVSPVTPPAPSAPAATSSRASTYNYTPAPSSSRPASSSQPSSSSAPSSSSEPSSESSSSSKESSSSSKESSSYEDVLVKEPTSNNNVPTKQKGVSWLVWGLILAGLAAILVAVGVIFYTHRNSGDRML